MKRVFGFEYELWREFLKNDTAYCLSSDMGVSSVDKLELGNDLLEQVENCLLIKTSGSSGEEKWVIHSKSGILKHATLVNNHLKVTSGDVFGLILPVYHVGGLGVIARAFVSGAGIVAYSQKWSADGCFRFLVENNISILSLVPTQVVDIVNDGLICPDCLRIVVVGGGALNDEVGKKAISLGWKIYESYGMTETGSQIATGKIASGKGAKIDYLSLLDGWKVRTNEFNILEVKGECLFKGYLTESAGGWVITDNKNDGWFTTSDKVELLEMDGKMGVRFISRKDLQVKILGELVDVSLLESRLNDLTQYEVHIIPICDDRRGAKLYPVVVDGENIATISDLNWSGLERLETPVLVSDFPRNEMGKLQRVKLARMVESIVFSAG